MACRQQPRGARPESRVCKCRRTAKYDTTEGNALTRTTGVAEDSDAKPIGMRRQKYHNIWQSPNRGKIGHAHVTDLVAVKRTGARAHNLGQSLSLTESGDDSRKYSRRCAVVVWISRRWRRMSLNRNENQTDVWRRLTLTAVGRVDEPMDVSRTQKTSVVAVAMGQLW